MVAALLGANDHKDQGGKESFIVNDEESEKNKSKLTAEATDEIHQQKKLVIQPKAVTKYEFPNVRRDEAIGNEENVSSGYTRDGGDEEQKESFGANQLNLQPESKPRDLLDDNIEEEEDDDNKESDKIDESDSDEESIENDTELRNVLRASESILDGKDLDNKNHDDSGSISEDSDGDDGDDGDSDDETDDAQEEQNQEHYNLREEEQESHEKDNEYPITSNRKKGLFGWTHRAEPEQTRSLLDNSEKRSSRNAKERADFHDTNQKNKNNEKEVSGPKTAVTFQFPKVQLELADECYSEEQIIRTDLDGEVYYGDCDPFQKDKEKEMAARMACQENASERKKGLFGGWKSRKQSPDQRRLVDINTEHDHRQSDGLQQRKDTENHKYEETQETNPLTKKASSRRRGLFGWRREGEQKDLLDDDSEDNDNESYEGSEANNSNDNHSESDSDDESGDDSDDERSIDGGNKEKRPEPNSIAPNKLSDRRGLFGWRPRPKDLLDDYGSTEEVEEEFENNCNEGKKVSERTGLFGWGPKKVKDLLDQDETEGNNAGISMQSKTRKSSATQSDGTETAKAPKNTSRLEQLLLKERSNQITSEESEELQKIIEFDKDHRFASMKVATEQTKDRKDWKEKLAKTVGVVLIPELYAEDSEDDENKLGRYRTIKMNNDSDDDEDDRENGQQQNEKEIELLRERIKQLEKEKTTWEVEAQCWKNRAKEYEKQLKEIKGRNGEEYNSSDEEDESEAENDGEDNVVADLLGGL